MKIVLGRSIIPFRLSAVYLFVVIFLTINSQEKKIQRHTPLKVPTHIGAREVDIEIQHY